MKAGIGGYLTKPIRKSDLSKSLLRLVEKQVAGDQTSSRRVALPDQGPSEPPQDVHRLEVLVAEDDRINQRVTQRLLENLGYSPEIVSNGKLAFERAMEKRFDVILMDVQMPEMDGITAVKKIREAEGPKGIHTPVIALTAHAMKGDIDACLAAGMDDYIAKPVRPDQIKSSIEALVPSSLTAASDDVLSSRDPIGS
jgi:CheY-like chemotaxis protein